MTSSIEQKISTLLKQCSFKQLKQIHGFLITSSLTQSTTISSQLLRRSAEFGHMEYTEHIFSASDGLPEIFLWNAMIRGYAYNGQFEKCIHMFDEMPQRGLIPNSYTYPYVLDACTSLGSFRDGKKIHCRVSKAGFDWVPSVGTSLLNFYVRMCRSCNLGDMGDARKVFDGLIAKSIGLWNRMISEYVNLGNVVSARRLFDEMPVKDIVSWNSMISGYARIKDIHSARELFVHMPEKNVVSWTSMIGAFADSGDLRAARRLFDEMPERNVVSWNCMISSYTQHKKFDQALNLFLQMQSEGVVLDGFTFVSALSACAHLGALEIGKWIHFHLIRDGTQLGVKVGTALVEMYAKCGDIDRAFRVFIKMVEKDVFCMNVMIKALALHGRTEDAIKLFAMMKKDGLKLNDFTFMSVLVACSHGGLVEEGRRIFGVMEKEFKIQPRIEHYGCLIDLLGRNGRLEEAHCVLKEMPYEPDIAVWGALLEACRVRNDVGSAEKVMERIAELRMNEAGIYVLLSNMYAASGQWNEALRARWKMEQKRILKSSGCSIVFKAADV